MPKIDMSMFETAHDQVLLPDNYIVVRVDGKSFHTFTKKMNYEKPFDIGFSKMMGYTTQVLMRDSGFKILYGYTQSDEISLLMHIGDETFGRRANKIISTLSGLASAAFTNAAHRGEVVFDARISLLPNVSRVVDYFQWRMDDASRNSISGSLFWKLVGNGMNERSAAKVMNGQSSGNIHEMLHSNFGMNWNDLPNWQKRGFGFYWNKVEKVGFNPKTQEQVATLRNTLVENRDLPLGVEYDNFLLELVERSIKHDR